MLYLLLILFPLSMAASAYLLRQRTEYSIPAAVVTLLVQMALIGQIPLEEPARLLGVVFTLSELNRLFLLVFLGAGLLGLTAAWHIPHGENFVPVALLILALVCGTLLLQDLFIVSLLLIASGLAAVLAIVDLPPRSVVLIGTRAIASALKYLVLMSIAGVLMYFGFVLADVYRPGEVAGQVMLSRFILALLATGFALRLALIPFHGWLLDLVEDAAPMVSALITAVVASSSLLVLILSWQSFPVLLIENPQGMVVLRLLALFTCVLSGLLALGHSGLRRTVGYLIIYNYGMVFYGLAAVSEIGLIGAIFESLNQTLAITLIFASVGLLERPDGRPAGVVRHDLLRRWPVAGAGFLAGCLAILGVPPFSGFAGKLLIYQVAWQQSWLEVLGLAAATLLIGLAIARLAGDRLLGPGEDDIEQDPLMLGETEVDRPAPRKLEREPRVAAAVVIALLLLCLFIGLFPQALIDIIREATQSLSFIRTVE
jgi:formate hydrogenlyase subunit 3/multisubunit Na+/H+ antiporter MnhD subunit